MLENSALGEKAKIKVMVCRNENSLSSKEPQVINSVWWVSGSLEMIYV